MSALSRKKYLFFQYLSFYAQLRMIFYNLETWPQGYKVIKPEFSLRLNIKCNDWLLADRCPQAANHYALF